MDKRFRQDSGFKPARDYLWFLKDAVGRYSKHNTETVYDALIKDRGNDRKRLAELVLVLYWSRDSMYIRMDSGHNVFIYSLLIDVNRYALDNLDGRDLEWYASTVRKGVKQMNISRHAGENNEENWIVLSYSNFGHSPTADDTDGEP